MNIADILKQGMGESYLVKNKLRPKRNVNKYKGFYESAVTMKSSMVFVRSNNLKSTINEVISYKASGEAVLAPEEGAVDKVKQLVKQRANAIGRFSKSVVKQKVGQAKELGAKIWETILKFLDKIKDFIMKVWGNLGSRKAKLEKAKKIYEEAMSKTDVNDEGKRKVKFPRFLVAPDLINIMKEIATFSEAVVNKGMNLMYDITDLTTESTGEKSFTYNEKMFSDFLKSSDTLMKEFAYIPISTINKRSEMVLSMINLLISAIDNLGKMSNGIKNLMSAQKKYIKQLQDKNDIEDGKRKLDEYNKTFKVFTNMTKVIYKIADGIVSASYDLTSGNAGVGDGVVKNKKK